VIQCHAFSIEFGVFSTITSFEGWWGVKLNLCYLKLFGSRVCVKQTGNRHAKLGKHDFTGIFLGYTLTDQNVWYINLYTGTTKTSHHAIFNKAWYLQDSRPLVVQLLYNLGLEHKDMPVTCPPPCPVQFAPYPSIATDSAPSEMALARMTHLPLRLSSAPNQPSQPQVTSTRHDTTISLSYGITPADMSQVYVSPSPYNDAFEEILDLQNLTTQSTALAAYHSSRRICNLSSVPWSLRLQPLVSLGGALGFAAPGWWPSTINQY
jgi:hypothetical protein